MNRFSKTVISIFLVFFLCFSFVNPVFAETSLDLVSSEEILEDVGYSEYDNSIISSEEIDSSAFEGKATEADIRALKRVTLAFNKTDKKIQHVLTVTLATANPDLLLDSITFTIYVNDLEVEKVTKTNVPIGVYTGDINLNQVLCHEQIKATITAKEDGDVQTWTVFDSRDLSNSMISMWAPGSNGTSEKNIEKHFVKHAKDTFVNVQTISEYCNQASSQLKTVRGQHVVGTLTTGYTPNVYKFYYNNRYIMVIGTATNPSGGIISFGGGTGSNMQD